MARVLLALLCAVFFSVVLAFSSATVMFAAIAALVLVLNVLRFPFMGLIFFGFVATFIPYTTVNVGIRVTISEAILGMVWLGVFWQMMQGRLAWQFGKTEQRLRYLMFYSALPFLVGQFMMSGAEGNGPVNWARWLLNLSPLLLFPVLVDNGLRRDQLIVSLLLGTLVMLLLSVGMFLKDHDANTFIVILEKLKYAHPEAVKDIFSANFSRMASPWVHPNLTGGVLVLFLPLAFFYALMQQGWRRLLGLSVVLLGAAGLLFSSSRGAIVSLTLVLLWLASYRVPYAGRVIGVALALAVALVLFYPPLQERLATTFSSSNASTEIRMDEYRRFPEAMARFPLGIGFKVDPPPPKTNLLGISNLWLNFIYKLGIPGMLLFIAVTTAWWRECRPRTSLREMSPERGIWIGSGAGLLAALLTGLFDHYYSFTMVLIALFWLVMAINLQSARSLRQGHDPLLCDEPYRKTEV
ncbi:O-antigen ligase family protein [Iodobacter fluviatilis]|uniref:Lipid A core - O-antigen ligase and related enzymes n=1 Tax=Iodobacter fluviatilis TaxID=537 RepID=A0A377Q588_9NEIS|nr:O-antigen ligase family protein [Iodobacter fluviatilis]TCU87094.1 O-antigen ligase-like membrane protein [Iodobacter fluviatilis]STQ90426.1 Lipid A core - O-antigen ligase and related enzymes [Iodobacter fluviatilis]